MPEQVFRRHFVSAAISAGVVSSVSARPVVAEAVNDGKAAAGSGCANLVS
ncbi:MAG TPA: hypothetical protein VEK33_06235 [Terriglobales bacterium]|nr:hypothetical protein [Terriglobales bacterium]